MLNAPNVKPLRHHLALAPGGRLTTPSGACWPETAVSNSSITRCLPWPEERHLHQVPRRGDLRVPSGRKHLAGALERGRPGASEVDHHALLVGSAVAAEPHRPGRAMSSSSNGSKRTRSIGCQSDMTASCAAGIWHSAAAPDRTITVGAKIGLAPNGNFYLIDLERFRSDPDQLVSRMARVMQQDGPRCRQYVEKNNARDTITVLAAPPGPAQAFTIMPQSVAREKTDRAAAFVGRLAEGTLKVYNGHWLEAAKAELTAFPGGQHDDIPDGISLAFNACAGAASASFRTRAGCATDGSSRDSAATSRQTRPLRSMGREKVHARGDGMPVPALLRRRSSAEFDPRDDRDSGARAAATISSA